MYGVNTDHNITDDGEAGNEISALFTTAVETLSGLLAKAVGPIIYGLISSHSTQDCAGGDGQDCGKRMSPSLSAAGIGDVFKEIGQGLHLFGFKHYSGASFTIKWVDNRLG